MGGHMPDHFDEQRIVRLMRPTDQLVQVFLLPHDLRTTRLMG